MMIDRAGLVGEDGETHQGIYDLSLMLPLPFIEIYCPLDAQSLRLSMLKAAVSDKPVIIRYPRSSMPDPAIEYSEIEKADELSCILLRKGSDCTVVVLGAIYESACLAADQLAATGITVDVYAVIKAKPFDLSHIIPSIRKTGKLIIAEDGVRRGGFGQYILPEILKNVPELKFSLLGVDETPLDQASRFELLASQKLDVNGFSAAVQELCLPG
jgi:1-deoxy-D-xylulose-5-phosphate synthase